MVAPHPDDAELGCGGLIARWSRELGPVTIVQLIKRNGPGDAEKSLACRAAHLLQSSFPVSSVWTGWHREELRRDAVLALLEGLRETEDPALTLVPAAGDMHQEHEMALVEARRAFKGRNLLTYEIVRSNLAFRPQVFVELSEQDVSHKVAAVACYESQRGKFYVSETAIRGLAVIRGAMSEYELAEAFAVEWLVQ